MTAEQRSPIEERVELCLTDETPDEGTWPVYLFESPAFSRESVEVVQGIRDKVLRLLSSELVDGASFNDIRTNKAKHRSRTRTDARLLNLKGILGASTIDLIKRGALPQVTVKEGEEIRSMDISSVN